METTQTSKFAKYVKGRRNCTAASEVSARV
jgi:hypothetical protein